ncbi:MAG TPA: hypothetical protein VHT30_03150, partial [Acidimicrobiales bacterium]|nr:hypothetical protein [Acidimicrobiales bacterium]
MSDAGSRPAPAWGRQVAGHFRIGQAGRPAGRTPMIGHAAVATARFGSLIGRSLLGRQALSRADSGVPLAGLPVRMPSLPML